MDLIVYADGWVQAGDKVYKAVYGKNGIGPKAGEGDGVSPEGTWKLREVFYRPDHVAKPNTGLPVRALTEQDGWCDKPGDPLYNQFVHLPYEGCIDESLWRSDHMYDIIVPIGYNDDPIVDNKGSAIFLHVVRPDFTPSTGCASVSLEDLLEIVPHLTQNSTLTFNSATLHKGAPVLWPYKPPMPR